MQSIIDAAQPGSVVHAGGCVYRETIVIDHPLTLDGQGGAELRGSDSWSNWSSTGANWISANAVPNLGSDTTGVFTDAFRAAHLEQVFVNGTGLTQVPSNPGAAQFALDSARHVILAVNPVGHTVEVTTRKAWAITQADNVTITNFTFRHAATAGQEHAIGNDGHANWVISNSSLIDAHGSAIGLGGGDVYSSVLNNTITRAGDQGITGYLDGHASIRGNTFSQNGWGGWDLNWGAGAIKTATSNDQTVDGNTIHDNGGPGIWCDIGCRGLTYSNNTVHDNNGPQILFEISTDARIFANAVWSGRDPTWPAIFISSSGRVEVLNNTVASDAVGISVVSAQRPDRPTSGTGGNYVHNNTIVMGRSDGHALEWLEYGVAGLFGPDRDNRGVNNAYWYPNDENGQVRYIWGRSGFSKLADFATTPGDVGGRYLTRADRDRALAGAGISLNP
ncbi:MAG: right-handed parallel beta-helix repeat-containing protein [Chloroflexota bacterium]|nr:right-handed parallel beta-helix repeat-containing protein [Chloroflexota bacterium]